MVNSISNIFHHLVFPADTISQALTRVFNKAASREANSMDQEVTRWTKVIGEIIQAPSKGEYSKVAQSSLSVADLLEPFCDSRSRDEVKAFGATKVKQLGTGELEFRRSVESIEICMAQKAAHADEFKALLGSGTDR